MEKSHTTYCIEIENLTVSFDGYRALAGINWSVPCGSAAAIIGPNGGGKSTLLRVLAGTVEPDEGTVRILGNAGRPPAGTISYVPQNEEIEWRFPISVFDVVLQGRLGRRSWWQRPSEEDKELAWEAIRRVKLEEHALRPIGDLSGGQRQRALLARAVAQDARLILLDEPATGLDATAQHDLLDILDEMKAEGKTIVTTTHDLDCLTERFDSVLCLRGYVVCHGTPRETLTPEILSKLFGRHIAVFSEEGEVTMVEHN